MLWKGRFIQNSDPSQWQTWCPLCCSSEPACAEQRAQGAAGEEALTQPNRDPTPSAPASTGALLSSAEHAPAGQSCTSRNHNSTAWDRNVFSISKASNANK